MIRHVFAWFIGEGHCPSCDGQLVEVEAGHHECGCGVVVDYERGGWRFMREHELRRLPGLAGMAHRGRAA